MINFNDARPHSSKDRALACGAKDGGSIPPGDTC